MCNFPIDGMSAQRNAQDVVFLKGQPHLLGKIISRRYHKID